MDQQDFQLGMTSGQGRSLQLGVTSGQGRSLQLQPLIIRKPPPSETEPTVSKKTKRKKNKARMSRDDHKENRGTSVSLHAK